MKRKGREEEKRKEKGKKKEGRKEKALGEARPARDFQERNKIK